MDEKTLNSEIVRSLKTTGAWAYKIPDMPSSLMIGGRFNPDKPCDVVASVRGKFIGIEAKMIKEWQGFGSRFLRANQIDSLNEQVESGGQAFIFLNVRINKPRENRLIIFNWFFWRDTFKSKIVPKKSMHLLPYIKGSKGEFNLEQFCVEVGHELRYGLHPKEFESRGMLSERRVGKSA